MKGIAESEVIHKSHNTTTNKNIGNVRIIVTMLWVNTIRGELWALEIKIWGHFTDDTTQWKNVLVSWPYLPLYPLLILKKPWWKQIGWGINFRGTNEKWLLEVL